MKKKNRKNNQSFRQNKTEEIPLKNRPKSSKDKYRHNKLRYLEEIDEDIDFEAFTEEE